jgi:GntR family transcriptional regulator
MNRVALVDETSPIPLYHQVTTILRHRIAQGVYVPDVPLPPENELCEQFQVSKSTVRQAVGELVAAGLVTRGRGRGTFVLPDALKLSGQRFAGSLADLRSEVERSRVLDISIERGVALPPRIGEALGLPEAKGTIVKRTRTMDGKPFAFTTNYLADGHGRLIKKEPLRRGSMIELLERGGVKVTGAVQSIRAEIAGSDVGAALGLAADAPVLFVERLMHGGDGEPVEIVQSWYRGDAYEYTVRLDLEPERPLAQLA